MNQPARIPGTKFPVNPDITVYTPPAYDMSNDPLYIDRLPLPSYDESTSSRHSGVVKSIAENLREENYHTFTALPYAFRDIVNHTPLTRKERKRLLCRLCKALYNHDILHGN